jgi:hypothetical protein
MKRSVGLHLRDMKKLNFHCRRLKNQLGKQAFFPMKNTNFHRALPRENDQKWCKSLLIPL